MNKNNQVMQKLLSIIMAFAFIIVNMPSVSQAEKSYSYSTDEKESNEQMTVLKKNSTKFANRLKYCSYGTAAGAGTGAAAGCAWGAAVGTATLPFIGTVVGCAGGAILGGSAGALGGGAIGCGYSVIQTWDWDKFTNMREFIKIETNVCYSYKKNNEEKVQTCDNNNNGTTKSHDFPIKKTVTANIKFTPKFIFLSSEDNDNYELYEEEIDGIKLRNILIPVRVEIDKTVKVRVRRNNIGIVSDRVKNIPPDVNGKEYFLFYIKNNPEITQEIEFEFNALANNNKETKALFTITYGNDENHIVDRTCAYPAEFTFTNEQ